MSTHPRGIDLNPDSIDPPTFIPGHSFDLGGYNEGRGRVSLAIEPVRAGDESASLWVYADGEEQPGISWTAGELRALAADLIARAELIERSTA